MKAARVVNGVVEVHDVPTPEPGHEEVRVRITASGVCHSDLHIARGDWFGIAAPMIGHEAIGVVEALVPGAEHYASEGDRVILGLGGIGGYWCGTCEYCMRGHSRHCVRGRSLLGTFAEEFCVWAPATVTLPDSVADEEAPLACGGLTAYGAIRKLHTYDVEPGRTIAIIGAAGGLGHYAVQLARVFGYRVVGIDVGEERLEFVRSLGADVAVSPDDALDAVADTGGVDAALVFTASLAGFRLGLQLLRKRSLLVGVGLPPTRDGNIELNPFEFFSKDITFVYSAVGTVQEMRELVGLAAEGKVRSHISRTGRLSDIDAIFADLEAGRYLGRAVITDLSG